MRWRARYTKEGAAVIRTMHPEIKRRIREGIRMLLENPLLGHELHFELSGFRSMRIGGYRVIYQVNDAGHSIDVHHAGRRRDVYEDFRELLAERAYLARH
ncbi:MAG: type II toxin-antitoxin system RelE/ParE family toxin [Deltaproteobacteria bacterium]|nr:type II toxin-antitoxin system RelE/ParE family toxin [Deltaproteobacteria bacterium]